MSIPESVTSIADYAFGDIEGLTSITIPSGVTSIGRRAFYSCDNLTLVTSNVTTPFVFGEEAFAKIKDTCKLYVPAGTKAAYIAAGWTEEVFKGGVYDGTEDTFTYTYAGKTLTYKITDKANKYVQVIEGSNAAIGNSGNGEVTIPSSMTIGGNTYTVTGIGDLAFNKCSGLTAIHLPESVTSIGNSAFASCSSLTSINIPDGVTSIGMGLFEKCSQLTSVEIPNSVTKIEMGAFRLCGLTAITIPSSVTSIEMIAFMGCSDLTSVTSKITTPFAFGEQAFNSISDDCKLYVPAGTKAAYIAAGWTEDIFKGGIYEMEVDLNGDGTLNISDVTALVNMVLGKTAKTPAADMNGDGEVNISDVTALVNMILGKN
jgi:hypothetical protein